MTKVRAGLGVLLWAMVMSTQALAGAWTAKSFIYKPALGARGATEKSTFDSGLDRGDARLGKEVWVGDPNYGSTFQDAIGAIGSSTATLRVPVGTYSITSNLTIPANITLKPERGAVFALADTKTLTINGGFQPVLCQVFSLTGSGKADLSNAKIDKFFAEWWYSGSGDFAPALNAAIQCAPTRPSINITWSGSYTCTTKVSVNRDKVNVRAQGISAGLGFNPASDETLFEFKRSDTAYPLSNCSLKDIYIIGYGSATKTSIKLVDVRAFHLENVEVWDDTGHGGIGLHMQGRDHTRVEKFKSWADRPILIDNNPYCNESLDAVVFRDLYLACKDTNGKNIEVASGTWLTAVTFEGAIHFNCGKYGFYWNDTTATLCSQHIKLSNMRFEQATTGGAGVYISTNQNLYALVLDNLQMDGSTGYYLRKVADATLRGCHYNGVYATPDKALDIDTTCGRVVLIDCYFANGSVSPGGMKKTFGTDMVYGGRGGQRTLEVYSSTTDLQYQSCLINGVRTWCYKGNLADGATLNIPPSNADLVGTIIVSAMKGSAAPESALFAVGQGAYRVKVAGTTNTSVNDDAGKLCLLGGSGCYVLKNNLGAAVDLVVTCYWNTSSEP